jgi:2-(1,2-epoxy-1,2-dihydrophenyl)acetyl-CoA isomerase
MEGSGIDVVSNSGVGVAFDPESFVATVEIRRPPDNYLDGKVLARVLDVTQTLAREGARAVVLCSEGKNFCAGANFGGGQPAKDGDPDVYDVGAALLEQPLPIVAALQGSTVGGGVGLALMADIRVAASESRFWVNFARLGFHHGFGLSATLPRAVGHSTAVELLFTGRRIGGAIAHDLGLVDHLVPTDEIRSRATEIAREIAECGPLATQAIRRTMRGGFAAEVRDAMAHERAIQDQLSRTADFAEGTRAMWERRSARFTGR